MNRTRFYDQFFNEVTPAGASLYPPDDWSTFSAVSDVGMAGFNLLSGGTIQGNQFQIPGGSTVLFDGEIDSDNNQWFLAGATMGIHNGQPVGFGTDINLVSENGWVIVSPRLGIGTTTPASEIDIVATSVTDSPSINITYAQGGVGDYAAGLHFFNENGLNGAFAATANGYTGGLDPNQLALVSFQSGGLNLYSSGPLIFSGGSIVSRFDPANGNLLIGSGSDDGTGAKIQSSNDISAASSYWAQGSQGGSGFSVLDADGVTTHAVIGGLIMP